MIKKLTNYRSSLNSIQKFIKLTKREHEIKLRCEGTSMMPILRSGDYITIKKTQFSHLKTNDVVMGIKNGRGFIHRIVYLLNDSPHPFAILKGDANVKADGKFTPSQIIGKVYEFKREKNLFPLETYYLVQSALYLKEITQVKRLLEKKKILFVILKGLPVHLFYEKRYPQRLYADCDVLININQYPMVEKELQNCGFKKAITDFSTLHRVLKGNNLTEVSFYKMVKGLLVVLDIHLEVVFLMNQIGRLDSLYPKSAIERVSRLFLEERQNISIQDEIYPLLSLPHQVVYLALHLFHHNFLGAYRYELLHNIVTAMSQKQNKQCIEEIVLLCNKYQLENFVYPVFYLLNKLYKIKNQPQLERVIFRHREKKNRLYERLNNINVFSGDNTIVSGISRFRNIIIYSPSPWFRKLMVFFNPAVIYTILWLAGRIVIRVPSQLLTRRE